jgi:predicted double-glycine peptidase
MLFEKNPRTRPIARKLLEISDKISGVSFPNMARVKQIDIYSCGPAVLAALYSIFNVKVNQKGIISSLRFQNKIKKYGLSMKDMARAASVIGKGAFSFWEKSNATITDLDMAINKFKSPVGVEWQGVFYEDADEDDGHYAIVTKIDKKANYLRMADPFVKFAGVDRRFKIDEFKKRWWDENDINVMGTTKKKRVVDNRVMFVLTRKDETWPKKLGMKNN